jgi:hypothetical protein
VPRCHHLAKHFRLARLWLRIMAVVMTMCCPAPAAASDAGALHLRVVDLQGNPVSGARIFVIGWDDQSSFVGVSDGGGNRIFASVPVGSYRIVVEETGFEGVSTTADVHADGQTVVEIKLAGLPRRLGVVQARSTASAYVVRLSENSPLRTLSTDLLSALSMVGGISVVSDADGQPAGASIRGQDPSTTTYQVDGLRLGGVTAMQAFGADLLTSAAVNLSRDQISLALAGPTSHATFTGDQLVGGFGAARGKWLVQDTTGAIGIVGAHVDRDAESALNGATYLDASGLSYRHVGTLHVINDYAKLVTPLGANTRATVGVLLTQQVMHPISTFYAGAVPAGIGPGQVIWAHGVTITAGVSAAAGPWYASVHVGASNSESVDDESGRVLDGLQTPFVGQTVSGFTAATLSAARPVGDGRTVSLTASEDVQHLQYQDWTSGAVTRSSSDFRTSYVAASYSVTAPGHALSSQTSVQLAGSGLAALAPGLQMQVSTNGYQGQTTALHLDWGAQPSYGGANPPLAEPSQAQYNCLARTITAQAPGDQNTAVTQGSTELDWSRTWGRGQIDTAVYDNRQDGALFGQMLVPATAVLNQLPSWYIGALQAGYSAYGACSGPPPSGASIFMSENVAGLRSRYAGVNIGASYQIARGFRVLAFYDIARAAIVSPDPRLSAPTSPYIVGSQLPGVPLHRLSLTGDWVLADHRTELLANMLREPVGNERHLPAYVLWTVGAQRLLSKNISMTLVGANVSHEYVGLFVSPRYAIPLPTVGGTPMGTVAMPLPQPQLSLVVHMTFGPGR